MTPSARFVEGMGSLSLESTLPPQPFLINCHPCPSTSLWMKATHPWSSTCHKHNYTSQIYHTYVSGRCDLATLFYLVTGRLQLSTVTTANQLQGKRIRHFLCHNKRKEVLSFKRNQEDMGDQRVHQSVISHWIFALFTLFKLFLF